MEKYTGGIPWIRCSIPGLDVLLLFATATASRPLPVDPEIVDSNRVLMVSLDLYHWQKDSFS